jgi:hypothetical protein
MADDTQLYDDMSEQDMDDLERTISDSDKDKPQQESE